MQSSRDHALASLGRASRLATILIEQADVEIERAGGIEVLALLDGLSRRSAVAPWGTVRLMRPEGSLVTNLGGIRGRLFGGSLIDDVWQFGRRETFTYGPFRNRPMRSKPNAQRRQRLARRIERAHRK